MYQDRLDALCTRSCHVAAAQGERVMRDVCDRYTRLPVGVRAPEAWSARVVVAGGRAMGGLKRYRSVVADSARWEGFVFRHGDIVISTPPKCGTTWMQTLCAMLVFDAIEFNPPLAEISPWLDMLVADRAEIVSGSGGSSTGGSSSPTHRWTGCPTTRA